MKSRSLIFTWRKFAEYAWGALIHPGATFEKLVAEPMPLLYGSIALVLIGILYTISQFIGYLNGFGACFQPFLPIAAKTYYFYQTFFTLAAFWLTTLVFAAVVQFFSAFLGGQGKFENMMAVACFSLQITMIPLMLIPETIMFTLSLHMPGNKLCGTTGMGDIVDNLRMFLAVFWQVIVTIIGVKHVQRYSWLKALVVGLLGLAVYELVFWTYIR